MTVIVVTKHHGFGNDFLVALDPPVELGDAAAQRFCDRHRGVGADGLLVGTSLEGGAVRMVLFNADGGRAETSGNGIRCFAQAVAARRSELGVVHVETDVGPRAVEVSPTDDPETVWAAVDLGPVAPLPAPGGWAQLGVHPDRPVAHYSVGNPHSVVGVDDVATVDLATLGRRIPTVNLEIIEPGPERHAVTMRVHERGAGLTQACGTGAAAAARAAVEWGLVDGARELLVHMDGGTATVCLDHPVPGHATLTGPVTHIAKIEIAAP